MKLKRKIIEIDEERCSGCGLCATACAEGAIEIKNGKARLVSEVYCDGLGACIGECPEDATIVDGNQKSSIRGSGGAPEGRPIKRRIKRPWLGVPFIPPDVCAGDGKPPATNR
jgi:ferredoxin